MKASERPMAKIINICSVIPGALDCYTERQQKVFNQIKFCRTEFMGVNVYNCSNSECGHRESRYSSCKNRNCSVCSWLPKEKWKQQRSNDMIPETAYYHYVFTLPYELSQICSANKRLVQTLLFNSVAETLKSFQKTHCNDGKIGFIQCLHTWSTRLLGLVNTTNQALNNECEQNKSLEYDVKLVKASGHSSESLQSPKQTLNFVSPFV